MTTLAEKHRPHLLSDIIGQPKAVATVAAMIARAGFGGRAVWISGPSGSGKTTLARIIAATVADSWVTTEFDSADSFGAEGLDTMRDSMGMFGFGTGGRAWIINEAHGLRAPIVRGLLGVLERLPAHVVVAFTTTKEGETKLFEDIDAAPLLSRCVPLSLTNQGLAPAFAERLLAIANAENLAAPSATIDDAMRIIRARKNNMRAALNDIEAGALLTPPATPAKPLAIAS